jgi:hypothetical protein
VDLEPAVGIHDTWGIRAIVVSWRGFQPEPRPRYLERWSRLAPVPDGLDTANILGDNRQIVALGITFPQGVAPTDAEVSRVLSADDLARIETRRVELGVGDGAFLYLRPNLADSGFVAWDAGTYWIDVFVDGELQRIVAILHEPLAGGPLADGLPAGESDRVPAAASTDG